MLLHYSQHERETLIPGALEGNELYETSLLDDGRFDGNVPLFARPPPALGRGAADRIRQMQPFLVRPSPRLLEAPEAKGDPVSLLYHSVPWLMHQMAYAFPHYREF